MFLPLEPKIFLYLKEKKYHQKCQTSVKPKINHDCKKKNIPKPNLSETNDTCLYLSRGKEVPQTMVL